MAPDQLALDVGDVPTRPAADDALPLNALLAGPIVELTATYGEAGAGTAVLPSPTLWFDFLRALPDDGIDPRAMPALVRTSKRVIYPHVNVATKAGWIAGDTRHIALTGDGRRARDTWLALPAQVEDGWPDRLRDALARLVGQLRLELPHYPISYGSADPTITGGMFAPYRKLPPDIPQSGQDWSPVFREGGDTTAGLPLTALLSQTLVAFAIDYERQSVGDLHHVSVVLRRITDGGRDLGELPPACGISGNRKPILERHGAVTVALNTPTRGRKLVRLTPRGKELRDAYRPTAASIEAQWRRRYGDDTITALRTELEAVARPADDPPHFPHLVWSATGFVDRTPAVMSAS